jgi:serine/threonine protein kinase
MSSICDGLKQERGCYMNLSELDVGGVASNIHVSMHICDSSARIMVIKEIDNKFNSTDIRHSFDIHRSLKHPNIIELCSWFEENEKIYNVIEYFESDDLSKSSLNVEDLCLVTKQIVAGLNYMHQQKIIHRDIKPQNILNNEEGVVKIIDFDMVINSGDDIEMGGTPSYQSPETFENEFSTSQDMWALGATLYEIISGKMFITKKGWASMAEILRLKQEDINRRIDKEILDGELKEIIKGVMRINTEERLSSKQVYDMLDCDLISI